MRSGRGTEGGVGGWKRKIQTPTSKLPRAGRPLDGSHPDGPPWPAFEKSGSALRSGIRIRGGAGSRARISAALGGCAALAAGAGSNLIGAAIGGGVSHGAAAGAALRAVSIARAACAFLLAADKGHGGAENQDIFFHV